VILDALLDRAPFGAQAAELFDAVERTALSGYVAAHAVTTVYYLAEKATDRATARHKVRLLLELFDVAPVNRALLADALAQGQPDFEDAVTQVAAHAVGADAIVTRNPKHFGGARVRVHTPAELIAALGLGR
jgi:predicted nucleic acid-binding protein